MHLGRDHDVVSGLSRGTKQQTMLRLDLPHYRFCFGLRQENVVMRSRGTAEDGLGRQVGRFTLEG